MRRRRYGERLHRDRGPLDASAGKRANQNDSRQCEGDDSNGAPHEYPRATRLAAASAQPMSRRPTHRCPLRLTSPVAPLVALDRGTHRPVPARQRAFERFLPRLDTSKVPDGVHNPPLGLAKPAELADGLALARYAALRRRFAPATTWDRIGSPARRPRMARRLGSLCAAARYHSPHRNRGDSPHGTEPLTACRRGRASLRLKPVPLPPQMQRAKRRV